jgi:hypothetical protein
LSFCFIEIGEFSLQELSDEIKTIENQIEATLWDSEVHEELEKALQAYQDAEGKLEALGLGEDSPAYPEQQRVLSYSLMRQGNILRQLGKPRKPSSLASVRSPQPALRAMRSPWGVR